MKANKLLIIFMLIFTSIILSSNKLEEPELPNTIVEEVRYKDVEKTNPTYKTLYVRDVNGNLKLSSTYRYDTTSSSWKPVSYIEFEFRDDGNYTKKSTGADYSLGAMTEDRVEYNDHCDISSIKKYSKSNAEWKLNSYEDYEYNLEYQLTSKKKYTISTQTGEPELSYETLYEYNEDGLESIRSEKGYYNGSVSSIWEYSFEYDVNKELTCQIKKAFTNTNVFMNAERETYTVENNQEITIIDKCTKSDLSEWTNSSKVIKELSKEKYLHESYLWQEGAWKLYVGHIYNYEYDKNDVLVSKKQYIKNATDLDYSLEYFYTFKHVEKSKSSPIGIIILIILLALICAFVGFYFVWKKEIKDKGFEAERKLKFLDKVYLFTEKIFSKK